MVDLLCSCGHLDIDHTYDMLIDEACLEQDSFNINKKCGCTKFSLDNLLYLEQLERESYYGNDR